MRKGVLFPKVENKQIRNRLRDSLLSIKCLIPSIKSMHENLKYLKTGSELLKKLLVGRVSKGTLRCTLRSEWEERRDALIESVSGVRQIIKNVSTETCWDLTYKQLWIFVLRRFADLGGRAPKKEVKERPYKPWEDPNLQLRFLRFALDLGLKTERILTCIANDPRKQDLRDFIGRRWNVQSTDLESFVEDMIRRLPINDKANEPHLDRKPLSKPEMTDLERRWGVPFTQTYEKGKASFYLAHFTNLAGNFDDMPSTTFIQQDFIKAFFGPTIELWDRLRDLPDERNTTYILEDRLESSPPSEYESSLEESVDAEIVNPVTDAPTVVSEFAYTMAETVPRPIISGTFPSVLSSVAPSPELSPVASIYSESLIDGISTPATALEAVARSLTEEHVQSLTEQVTLADGQMGLHYSRGQIDGVSTATLPQEHPRSPIMSLVKPLPRALVQYEPTSDKTTAPMANSTEFSALPISPTDEAMLIDPTWDVSHNPSYQLPSEPRRSIPSWPTAPDHQGSTPKVESYPSTLVSALSLLRNPEWRTSPTQSEPLSLPPDARRSTVSLVPWSQFSETVALRDRDKTEALHDGMRRSGTSPILIEPAPASLHQSEQIDLPLEPRRSVDSLLLSYMSAHSPTRDSQLVPASYSEIQVRQTRISRAESSSLSTAAQTSLPLDPRRSIDSLLSLPPTAPSPVESLLDSYMSVDSSASASQMDLTSGQVEQPKSSLSAEGPPVSEVAQPPEARGSSDSIHLIKESQETQHAFEPPPPVTQEPQGEGSTNESNDIELVDDPPATTFRFFEYNGTYVTPKTIVSRANMEIYLGRNWIWCKIDGKRLRTIRREKVIDYMARSGGFEYCAMPKDPRLVREAAHALEAHLQRRHKRATTGAVKTHQQKRDLQKRKRQGIIGDRSEGNPMRIGTGSTDYSMALRSHTYPDPLAQDVTAWPDSVAWLSSRPWVVRIKVFDKEHNQECCEKEQQNPDWPLLSSQLCFLIYTASSRRLLVFDALQPLSEEDERLLCDNFTFMMTARKLSQVELETALKVVPHFPIWLVPKNEVDFFKRWAEGLHLTRHQPAHGSPQIQPIAPDVETLGDESIFDDDSVGDEFISEAHSRGHEEDEGQLTQDDPVALPQSATAKSISPGTFGIATSRPGQSSRGVSPTPAEPRASNADASLTEAATTPPSAARAPSLDNFPGRIPITQERAKVDHSEVEMPKDPAIWPGLKRPFTPDDAVHVRTRTDEEPERKRPRGNNLMQQPLPQGGTASTRSQADEEPGLKQLWIERWREGGAKRQRLKVKGQGRKLVGLLEKSKQRKKSALTPEEIQRRHRGMLHKVELDFVEEEL